MTVQIGQKQNTGSIDIQRTGLSLAVLMYFLAIIAVNQVAGAVTSAFYYLAIFTGAVLFFGLKRSMGIRPTVLLAIGAGALCGLNTVFVGNMTIVLTMIMVASFFVAALMLDEGVDERAFLIALYLNAGVALIRLVLFGNKVSVYVGSTNNYVSIHLLAPGLLYYSLLDARGKKIPIFPAFVIWTLSLLAGGRGGLLASTILLMGVILRRYLADGTARRDRILLGLLLAVIMIPVLVILAWSIFMSGSDLYVINRFLDKGMDGGGRIDCWIEYIQAMFSSAKNFLLGVNTDTLWWGRHYNGNLHNSFLFVHAYMGIFGFGTFLFLIGRACLRAIRNGKGVYLCCILTLCFRGLTDHMFGGNRMTAIVIAMVLLPDFVGLGKKTGGQVGKILRRVYTKEVDTLEKEDVPDEKTVTSNGLSKQEPGVALVTRPATNAMTKLRDRNI